MPWNPEIYNRFKNIRYQPFFDLMGLISDENLKNAVDLGCGTGEQTKILSENFEKTNFLGLDSSEEMLIKSQNYENTNLKFEKRSFLEFLDTDKKWDLIFSNAALQWQEDHQYFFPKILDKLSAKGQFAVQMPVQNENILNQILNQLASEKPFSDFLQNYVSNSPILKIDDYAQIMFENGLENIQISVKIYPIIAQNTDELFQFISGSALIPYLEKLDENQKITFTEEFKKRISRKFQKFPAIYPFKRLLMYGKKI